MLVACVVQAAPVAAAPLEHEHTFWVHPRLVVPPQAVVTLFPVSQVAHSLHTRLVVAVQGVDAYVPPTQVAH